MKKAERLKPVKIKPTQICKPDGKPCEMLKICCGKWYCACGKTPAECLMEQV